MKRRTLRLRRLRDRATAALAAVGAVTLVAGSVVMITSGTASADDEDHKISICHATGSATNPYERGVGGIPKEQITAPDGHGGDAANHPGDIIPAFAAGSHGGQSWPAFEGRNLDLLHVLNNGCQLVPVTPEIEVNDPCGTENDTVTGISKAGYTFQVSGDTVTFTARPGYKLDGDSVLKATWTNVPCDVVADKPVAPEIDWDDPCGTSNDTVAGVAKDGYTFVVNDDTGEVTFTAMDGYVLDGPSTLKAEWTNVPCDVVADKPVTPEIDWDDPCGTSNDTVAGVAKDGYTFVVDDEMGEVTFIAKDGYVLDGPSTLKATWTNKPCDVVVDKPVKPEITWSDPCGTSDDTVDGVAKDGYTFEVDDETGEVTFAAKDGYVLDGPRTLKATWTDEPCPRYATPTDPEVDESQECEVEGRFSIPETWGVQYFLDGEPIEPGTYDGPVDGLLTAEPVEDTVLTEDDWEYDLVLDEAEECDEVLPDEETGEDTDEDTDQPAEDKPDEVKGAAQERPRPTGPVVAPTRGGVAATALPTSVNAGLGATAATATDPRSGLGLLLAGAGMLLIAGSMQLGRRRQTRSQA